MTHRLLVDGYQVGAQRWGKNRVALELAEEHARKGEHVHLSFEKCWNGTELCDTYVKERFHWDGSALVPSGGKIC